MARESKQEKAKREAHEARVKENNSKTGGQVAHVRQQNSAVEVGRDSGRPADYNLLGAAVGAETIDLRNGDHVVQAPAGAKQLYIGDDGAVSLIMVDGSEVTFENAKSGTTLDIQFVAVYKEGTTASKLVALY